MLMQNMDEAFDIKPTVTIEGKQLELLKIDSAATGQKYELKAVATIVAVGQNKAESGEVESRITFELEQIELVPPQPDISSMYSNSPAPSER